ncbi:MAG: hypothetical protein GYB31_01280 [Bacteroidetes bacterium]|nr:hypothetical protein [Bacteroidota bacterium]
MKSVWSTVLIILSLAILIFFGVRHLILKQDFVADQTPETTSVETDSLQAQSKPEIQEPLLQPEPEDQMPELEMEDGYYRIDWQLLAKIDFEEKFNEEVEDYIFYPIFHPSVKALEGKPVIIEGFVIPFEETGQEDLLILSAFPFSNCFFCGNAGPESVMDIQLKKPLSKRAKQDDEMNFRGKLHLNDTDLYYMNYMLLEAEPVD